ncbi:MAG: hypothetical protein Q8L76_05855, partial [Cypionkella sp.]|nr:hypothetical protein [Cypionkella sp.]
PLTVLMNGQQRELRVTGIALSPEFIYALGLGEMMPDPRRFGIAWLPRPALESALDLEGAFSKGRVLECRAQAGAGGIG